MSTQLVKSF